MEMIAQCIPYQMYVKYHLRVFKRVAFWTGILVVKVNQRVYVNSLYLKTISTPIQFICHLACVADVI